MTSKAQLDFEKALPTGLCDGKGADCIILFIVGRCVNLGGGG